MNDYRIKIDPADALLVLGHINAFDSAEGAIIRDREALWLRNWAYYAVGEVCKELENIREAK